MQASVMKNANPDFSKFAFWVEEAPQRNKVIQEPLPEASPGTFPDAFPGEGRGPQKRESSHVRAVKLRARMAKFTEIYQAAWMVRYTQHSNPEVRQAKVAKFMSALKIEMENCRDPEALMFAVADALTSFPYGVPWEG